MNLPGAQSLSAQSLGIQSLCESLDSLNLSVNPSKSQSQVRAHFQSLGLSLSAVACLSNSLGCVQSLTESLGSLSI